MRQKKLLAIVLSLALLAGTMPAALAQEQTFLDVSPDHWAYPVIEKWSSAAYGVLQGDGDGTFAPSRGLTLAELAAVLSELLGIRSGTPARFRRPGPTPWWGRPWRPASLTRPTALTPAWA